jgi:translation elongation factor P/translation initiation factor 5A
VYEEDPAEYARIEGDELVFPMTKWNYRMIVIEKAAGGEAPSVLRDNGR